MFVINVINRDHFCIKVLIWDQKVELYLFVISEEFIRTVIITAEFDCIWKNTPVLL